MGARLDANETNVLYDGQFMEVINADNAVMAKGSAFNLLFWNS